MPVFPRKFHHRPLAGTALSLLVLAASAAPDWAREWHVDDQGSVTSGCTGGNDLTDAFLTIQAAVDCMAPGDTVLVHSGTYGGWGDCRPSDPTSCLSEPSTGRLLHLVAVNLGGGGPGQRYTIMAAPGEAPVLDGLAVATEPLDAAFFVVDSDFVTIRGFTMRRFSAKSHFCNGCGIERFGTIVWNERSDDGEVLDNVITETDPAGASCCFAADLNFGPTAQRLRISGNTIVTQLPVGISFHNTEPPAATFRYKNEVSGNHITQTLDYGNSFFLRAVFLDRVNGVRISNNYIENTGLKRPDSAAIFLRDGNSIDVRGNIVRGYGTGVLLQDGALAAGPTDFNDREMHVIANNVFDAINPIGTEAAINNRNGDARSCDGCVIRNNVVVDYQRGFELDQILPDPWFVRAIIGNNVMHNVATPTTGTAFNGDAIVESNNVFDAPNPLNLAPPRPSALDWTGRASGELTRGAPWYQILPGSVPQDFGAASVCPWSPADGLCDAGAYELTGIRPPLCIDLGGVVCLLGETCLGGLFELSSDAGNLCCVGGTCIAAPPCVDADGDGYGEGCTPGPDCDDLDPAANPGAGEKCNLADDDCDGATDENISTVTLCGTGACRRSVSQTCAAGALAPACRSGPPGTETCNAADDDCDGATDEENICGTTEETHVVEAERGARTLEMELVADPEARFGLAIRPRAGTPSRPCARSPVGSIHPIQIDRPGVYHMWVRLKGAGYSSDALCVGLDLVNVDRVSPSTIDSYEWVQVKVSRASGNLHYLEEGLHEIFVTGGEPLAIIDAICMTSTLDQGSLPCAEAASEQLPVDASSPGRRPVRGGLRGR